MKGKATPREFGISPEKFGMIIPNLMVRVI